MRAWREKERGEKSCGNGSCREGRGGPWRGRVKIFQRPPDRWRDISQSSLAQLVISRVNADSSSSFHSFSSVRVTLMTPSTDMDTFSQRLRSSKRIIAVAGAGLSAASGWFTDKAKLLAVRQCS